MNELIKVSTDSKGKQVLSARDLYERLGMSLPNWAKWSEKNIANNEYMANGVDWEGFIREMNGNQVKDYAITIDFAKRIIARAKTPEGEKYLTYLIEVEKKYVASQRTPGTYIDALKALLAAEEEKMVLQYELAEAQPKIDFFDQVADSKDAIEIGAAARVLNIGMGRNTLFEKLRQAKVLMRNNQPYQKYIDMGWFRTIEQSYTKPDGSKNINIKTLVYQKGLQGISKIVGVNQ
jgi:anti-repressor protein